MLVSNSWVDADFDATGSCLLPSEWTRWGFLMMDVRLALGHRRGRCRVAQGCLLTVFFRWVSRWKHKMYWKRHTRRASLLNTKFRAMLHQFLYLKRRESSTRTCICCSIDPMSVMMTMCFPPCTKPCAFLNVTNRRY